MKTLTDEPSPDPMVPAELLVFTAFLDFAAVAGAFGAKRRASSRHFVVATKYSGPSIAARYYRNPAGRSFFANCGRYLPLRHNVLRCDGAVQPKPDVFARLQTGRRRRPSRKDGACGKLDAAAS